MAWSRVKGCSGRLAGTARRGLGWSGRRPSRDERHLPRPSTPATPFANPARRNPQCGRWRGQSPASHRHRRPCRRRGRRQPLGFRAATTSRHPGRLAPGVLNLAALPLPRPRPTAAAGLTSTRLPPGCAPRRTRSSRWVWGGRKVIGCCLGVSWEQSGGVVAPGAGCWRLRGAPMRGGRGCAVGPSTPHLLRHPLSLPPTPLQPPPNQPHPTRPRKPWTAVASPFAATPGPGPLATPTLGPASPPCWRVGSCWKRRPCR